MTTIQHALEVALRHHQAGQLQEAENLYRQILAQQPDHPDALHLLGVIALQRGQNDVAVDLIGCAIALRPDWPEPYNNLGNALKRKGELDGAIAAYRRAIALKPDYAEAHGNLGVALKDKGELDQAIAAHRLAIALKPTSAASFSNLGNALASKGELDEALAAYRQAIALRPNVPEFYDSIGTVLTSKAQLDEGLAAYRQAIALNHNYSEAHSNLIYAMHLHAGYGGARIAEEHRRWNRQFAEPLSKFIQPHANSRDRDRRLRIGYVSPDLREHPVGRFLLPLLAHHDHQNFEIFAYDASSAPDSITRRLMSATDQWRRIAGLSDQEVAELIRRDQIDILIDLSMHAAHNRLQVFARKPAPVQVTYLAYCSSTGLKTIDYRLSDPWIDPIERSTAVPAVAAGGTPVLPEDPFDSAQGRDESIYSEKTIRLPQTYWCYQPHITTPEVSPLPALEQGVVTFGCLNNFCKVSEPVLTAWGEILRRVPRSHLLLHAYEGSHRQQVKERLDNMGIDPKRLRFVGRVPAPQYFALYHGIDVALDTFPCAGGTTTCDALWMGVPVVSLAGETAVGRGGVSILSNLGLPEWVGRSRDQYIRIATDLAGDLPRLSELRSTLRQRMERSPLMDAPRFARDIESAYRRMWRTWCAAWF